MKRMQIFGMLSKDMDQIEKELYRSVQGDDELLAETSLHLLKAGGKRLRPVFVLMGGKFGQYDLEKLKRVAIPLELIHSASLVHDDVIDDAELRRGELTVKAKWGDKIAMYTGDYIYAKALVIASELQNPRIHQILSKAMVEMSIGEMEQIRDFFNSGQSVRHYLRRIRRKTALLIAISCELGALAADAEPGTARLLYDYGYNVGMAFQIRDDLLDLSGTEKQIGKPPGSDMRQGNITLPVIYSLEDSRLRTPLLDELALIRSGQAGVGRAIDLILSGDGITRAEELASRYIDKALVALEQLPVNKTRRNLRDIAYFVTGRAY
ncbi:MULTISPECIES: polyprenyl synthetase family protein [unclassified Paenibacillus]|uniref:polyprenyl synthetase family protein n=1 Tax=unclassified Paenibacillus TaxID=185978 RepID=UPI002406F007|nr:MULTISPECIES: polyprenyl synthetase family protein [unclassified Paenibacillus]MDF9840322.1 heptaprenyl diphosphate synthase [Paenibacillus sp. PastF-2]MDF9846904.1 heptaprenyl diphosphate synthase [Paenibacillus sp. PastM-2]MDF9853476.1 heptaprenyl diphosphate synthase [Paenibacillus sp. PastF-1]MDH6479037.1 heptaprenyl diphosphate synthase [Paenibacillus sp. PastH-2]MDH6506769.1 heptaprenyl diphosphate synthase [Paenibacillus sp. PastM-3]